MWHEAFFQLKDKIFIQSEVQKLPDQIMVVLKCKIITDNLMYIITVYATYIYNSFLCF